MRPSKDEIERKRRKAEEVHAEWEALTEFADERDLRVGHYDHALALARAVGFEKLADRIKRCYVTNGGSKQWRDFKDFHSDAEPTGRGGGSKPFSLDHDMDRVAELKADAEERLPDGEVTVDAESEPGYRWDVDVTIEE